jgi:hypothetical protein
MVDLSVRQVFLQNSGLSEADNDAKVRVDLLVG